jgi:NAD(P)-dependent dehydrogenase (short-subunit alcohol dehydrogenase family)
MASTPSPSQANAGQVGQFVPTLHTDIYAAIDPSTNRLPQPFTAVILGGSGAVGSGLARSYARAGATGIVVAARRLDEIEKVAEEAKTINPSLKTLAVRCDVSSASDIAAVAKATKVQFGATVGAVIVNAGHSGPFVSDITQETVEDFQKAFNVNTLGPAYAAQSFIPLLNESAAAASTSFKGLFIAISSLAALTVTSPVTDIHYNVSKYAQSRIIEMLHEERLRLKGGNDGIFFASVHPGGINSDFAKSKNVPDYIIPRMPPCFF